jgi:SAM-dependent methyltransferase
MSKPYLDFYKKHGSALVSRQLGVLSEFFRKREGLFLALGIPPGYVEGKSVLEFGPGTGHNSLFTDSLSPSRYVLVDGGDEILNAAKARLAVSENRSIEHTFVVSLFEEFETVEKFDLVIAEACIPNQIDPAKTFRRMCEFVKPGGMMVFTTVSAATWLSEIVRRLVRIEVSDNSQSLEELLDLLEKKLSGHFTALEGMSRTPREWILDNLIQPYFGGRLFSIPEAVEQLPSDFVISGTSPRFFQDWSWYKDTGFWGEPQHTRFVNCYLSNVANFVDNREIYPPHDVQIGRTIEALSEKVWDDIRELEAGDIAARVEVYTGLEEISATLHGPSPDTALALAEAVTWIKSGLDGTSLIHFPSWWGRGQQHVGLYRKI